MNDKGGMMAIEVIIGISLGIAIAGFFIGNGLKNFKNPTQKLFETFDEDEMELIKESDLHYHIGVTKEDAKMLRKEHPDVPHLELNGNIYYPKKKLGEWLSEIGD